MLFSLCIPTMDRFSFLKDSLPIYILNPFISEIIICDENGNDVRLIKQSFNSDKLKLYVNDSRLGPFRNKLKSLRLANNEWISLIDSDNFADNDYFECASKYIINKNPSKLSIIQPSQALPNFILPMKEDKIYSKSNISEIGNTFINAGNYIINKYLVSNVNTELETKNIDQSESCDVILFNLILFDQFELEFHVLANLKYQHRIHNNSVYLTTHRNHTAFNKYIYNRFKQL